MTAQFTLPAGITDAEAFTLTRLGHHEEWRGEMAIVRQSEREWDLNVCGHKAGWTPKGPDESRRSMFTAWLPLAMLHLWWGDKQCSHLVDDMGTGDFSFVRDREPDEIWAMFDACRAADGYEHDSPNCSLPGCGYNDPHDFYNAPGYWLCMLLCEADMYVDIDSAEFVYFDNDDIRQYDAYTTYWDSDITMNPMQFYGLEKSL